MNISDSDPKQILCIGQGLFPYTSGGLNRYVYELIRQLILVKDQVELCGVDLENICSIPHLKLTNLAATKQALSERIWCCRRNFYKRILQKPDAINLHFSLYSWPLMSSFPKDVPITFTFHGPWFLESQKEGGSRLRTFLKYWMEQSVYRRCNRFIVLSQAFGQILTEQYKISPDKIHLIPGGVDINHFQSDLTRSQAREQLNWPQDRPILFTPRRLVHRMGLSELLEAFTEVKKVIPDVWLVIAGEGLLRKTLEKQAIDQEISEDVKFLGFLPEEELPLAYQAANLTIVPSQTLEGFGLIVVESLACGTPVVCTPVGGMPEILESFSPQLITETCDTKAIASHLKGVLKGDISRPSRAACRHYAVSRFSWPHITQQVRQVLLA